MRTLPRLAALLGALLLVGHRLVAAARESVNWDEFGVFFRTARMLATGQIQGGGRPGLVELLLGPFVSGCVDGVATVVAARWVWTVPLLLGVAAVAVLAARLQQRPEDRFPAAALAVGLLVLVPVWLRWSLHVRTDVVAIACGLWAPLVALRGRGVVTGSAAGILAAVGFLVSQKLLYVLPLATVAALGPEWIRGELNRARVIDLAKRAGFMILGAGVVAATWRWVVPLVVAQPPSLPTMQGQLQSMAFNSNFVGWRAYEAVLPSLLPHELVVGAIAVVSLSALSFRERRRPLVIAWGLLALGTAIVLFHKSRYPYFWMTVGIAPSLAVAAAWRPITDALGRWQRPFVAALWVLLVVRAVPYAAGLLEDTQRVQRDSLSFVEAQFAPLDAGVSPEGALFCRDEPDPLPPYNGESARAQFEGTRGTANAARFIEEMRRRPVLFFVSGTSVPAMHPDIATFTNEHYAWLRDQVWVHGLELRGAAGTRRTLDVLAETTFRWHPPEGSTARIEVDGRTVDAGSTVTLTKGSHEIALVDPARPPIEARPGLFVIDKGAPGPRVGRFYSLASDREIFGGAE